MNDQKKPNAGLNALVAHTLASGGYVPRYVLRSLSRAEATQACISQAGMRDRDRRDRALGRLYGELKKARERAKGHPEDRAKLKRAMTRVRKLRVQLWSLAVLLDRLSKQEGTPL
jgi:hypothetical protein